MDRRLESTNFSGLKDGETENGNLFQGIRFVLAGFDPSSEHQYAAELENNGAFNVGRYDASCTHIIVHRLVYDDPICVAARKDKKTLVSDLWVADSLDMGVLADTNRILYQPIKDLSGIPGSESLCICLTGYQSQARSDIMRMVEMMGARFTKPLIASKVTHLICYKFEGDKYRLAKETGLKLVNHCWLEDCLKMWALLPEDNYQISGHQLELLEAEAKDSEDDGVGKICLPTPLKQSVVSGTQISPHMPLGMLNSKPFFNPDEQVPGDKKLDMAKPFPKENTKSKIDGQVNVSEKLLSMQGGGPNSSKKLDLGILLQRNADANKESIDLNETDVHEALEMPNHKAGVEIRSVERKRDMVGAKVEQGICTSALHVSTGIVYARKTPMKIGGDDLIRTPTQGINLMNETKEIFNVPSSVARKISETNQSSNRDLCDRTEADEREATEIDVKHSLLGSTIEPKKQSMNINSLLKVPSVNAKIQKRKVSLSVDSNLGFKKVRRDTGEADSPKLDKACDAGKLVSPMHTEETSTAAFVVANSEFQHRIDDHSSNLGNLSPMDSIGGAGNKNFVDLGPRELQLRDFETQNGVCNLEVTTKGKRQRQSKGSGPNKRKNAMSSSGAASRVQILHSNPTDANHAEEIGDQMELSVEKQSIDKSMSEIKVNMGNNLQLPSLAHTSGGSSCKTPNSITLLKPSSMNASSASSLKVSRKLQIHSNGIPKEDKADTIDLDLTTRTGINCNPQSQFVLVTDTSDAPHSKSDVVDNKQVDAFEGSGIPIKNSVQKAEKVLSSISTERHFDIAPTEKSKKRGRPFRKTKVAHAESVDPSVGQTKYQDGIESLAVEDQPVEIQCTSKSIGGSASETGSPCMLLHKEQKSDVTPISACPVNKSEDLEAPASVEESHCNNILNSVPYKSNACRGPVNGTMNQHSFPTTHSGNNAGLEMLQIAVNLQVSEEDVRKQSIQTKDAQNIEMVSSNTKADEIVQSNEGGNNHKGAVSQGKKSRGGANIKGAAGKKALTANQNSVECMHDREQDTFSLNEAPKVKMGKSANMRPSSKASERSRADSVASQKCQDASMPAKLGISETMVHFEPRWFMLSGHRLQRKEFQQFVKSLGGRLCRDSHQWCYQATHLVIPEPLRRTEKFFAAAAAGRWILTSDYLTASKQAGKFLDEQQYEWHKSGLSEDGNISFEAPRKWRLLREKTGHGALHGLRFIVYGECIAPSLDTLKRVVKAGGGVILATCPPYNRFIAAGVDIAIIGTRIPCDDPWIQEFLRHNIGCVLVDYIVEYVCKPSYPLDKHILYGTHAAVEKSLKSMNMRIHSAAVSNKAEQAALRAPKQENIVEPEEEQKAEQVCEVLCSVCGLGDRDDVLLLCGDDQGQGCGIAMHIDCCQPPLDAVPQEDWFCPECQSLH